MEKLSEFPFLLATLIGYNLLFFRKFYSNPYLLSTSELLSTSFPFWRWMGRQLSCGKLPFRDSIYYFYPGCIPFLSTMYIPNILSSLICKKLCDDTAYKVYVYYILAHYVLMSFLAYTFFLTWTTPVYALFGAVTLSYSAYMVKPLTPSFVYSATWVAGVFIGGWVSVLCVTMAILGGYWPILVYILPVACFERFPEIALGTLLAMPQIIPFLWYYRRSIRSGKKEDRTFGRMPFISLLWGLVGHISTKPRSGVHYPEMMLYTGILTLPLMFYSDSRFWFVLIASLLVAMGYLPAIGRIPARALYLFTWAVAILSTHGLSNLILSSNQLYILLALHGWSLLKNTDVYPHFPFAEWWRKPSDAYIGSIDDFPNFTGYQHDRPTKGYTGGFALKETMERNNITNPEGKRVTH